MKRIATIILLMCCLFATQSVLAQQGLNINQLFGGRYQKSAKATEIAVTGKKAKSINLNVYRSVTLSDDPSGVAQIERLVKKDGSRAIDKEVELRGGRLYYGYYVLSPLDGNNRYIFYLNQELSHKNPADKATLIYMEGKASSEYIKNLIRK